MCGINGIVFKNIEPDISKILGMNKLLNHEGLILQVTKSLRNYYWVILDYQF